MPRDKLAKLRSKQFAKNINSKKPKSMFDEIKTNAGPYIIAFFACVIVGSLLFQVLGAFTKQNDIY
jgi:hypothetical protein